MKYTNEQLQTMIAREPIGDIYPYNTKDEDLIDEYIQNLYDTFNRSKIIKCETDDHGSGYASYVDFFCYKRDGGSVLEEKYIEEYLCTEIHLEGLAIYISRLAPVAIIAKDARWKTIINTDKEQDEYFSAKSHICPDEVITESPDFMVEEFLEIITKLGNAGYSILDKEYISKPLSFETKIPTILTIPELNEIYKVFDGIFYWMD